MERDPFMELENRIAKAARFATEFDSETLGPPSAYICPDCNGSLAAISEGNYRCRVGHAWTPDALLRARDERGRAGACGSPCAAFRRSRKCPADWRIRPARLRSPRGTRMLADEAEHAIAVLSQRLSAVSQSAEDTGG